MCEIASFLARLGDEEPRIKPTIARGIVGVRTLLDPRTLIRELKTLFQEDVSKFHYTLKWIPIDIWTKSDIELMKKAAGQIRNKIKPGETWRMTVEKRRYTQHHRSDIITELAELISEKVDLRNPDKILRIDIIGKYAGLSVLTTDEIFSARKMTP